MALVMHVIYFVKPNKIETVLEQYSWLLYLLMDVRIFFAAVV